MPYYAIGLHNYVEIRRAVRRPQKSVTTVTTRGGTNRRLKRKISITNYSGGRVLGYYPARRFAVLAGHNVERGEMLHISTETFTRVKPFLQ